MKIFVYILAIKFANKWDKSLNLNCTLSEACTLLNHVAIKDILNTFFWHIKGYETKWIFLEVGNEKPANMRVRLGDYSQVSDQ